MEELAATTIGRVVLVLSQLELNVGLYLRSAVGGADPQGANPLVERLSLKGKLDALRDVAEHKFDSRSQANVELRQWLAAMAAFRTKRNSFVHGRWAFLAHAQEIVNVSPGLPNGKPQKEVRYSLETLQTELRKAQRLAEDFEQWARRFPL